MCPNLVSISKWYTDCLTEEFSVSVILSHKLKGLQRSELKVWILKLNEVFTINNVYILCFSLSKVCEGLTHFARRSDGTQQSLPIFPGLKGPDISRSLNEVEATFMKNLIILKNVKHTILDVKVSFHLFVCDSIFIICFFLLFCWYLNTNNLGIMLGKTIATQHGFLQLKKNVEWYLPKTDLIYFIYIIRQLRGMTITISSVQVSKI